MFTVGGGLSAFSATLVSDMLIVRSSVADEMLSGFGEVELGAPKSSSSNPKSSDLLLTIAYACRLYHR